MRLEWSSPRRRAPALTALVDVVFILLFFFMLAARPPPSRALELQARVPDAAGMSVAGKTAAALVLSGRRLRFGAQEAEAEVLAPRLRAQGIDALGLRTDPSAQLQDLLDARDALQAAGIAVHLAASPQSGTP